MSPERQKELASKGGKNAVNRKKWTTEEAREAGKLGGAKVSEDREHMSRIGRMGGRGKQRPKAA